MERFGDRVLNEPPRTGFALLGWVTPIVAILAGVGILALISPTFKVRKAVGTRFS